LERTKATPVGIDPTGGNPNGRNVRICKTTPAQRAHRPATDELNHAPIMSDPIQKSPSRVFSRRILTRLLFAAACLLTLLAILYAEENWRGKRAWENCRQQLEAKGVDFN